MNSECSSWYLLQVRGVAWACHAGARAVCKHSTVLMRAMHRPAPVDTRSRRERGDPFAPRRTGGSTRRSSSHPGPLHIEEWRDASRRVPCRARRGVDGPPVCRAWLMPRCGLRGGGVWFACQAFGAVLRLSPNPALQGTRCKRASLSVVAPRSRCPLGRRHWRAPELCVSHYISSNYELLAG
jgi:hypothetical protein